MISEVNRHHRNEITHRDNWLYLQNTRWKNASIIFLTLILSITSCATKQEATVKSPTPAAATAATPTATPEALDAEEFINEYVENPKASDKKYKGRKITVTGPVAIVKTKDELSITVGNLVNPVSLWCSFPETERPKVEKLQVGKPATVIGTVKGYERETYIQLTGCVLVDH